MSAGLPGLGLSGVFFIVSALLMLPLEVVCTLRGRSSLARWGSVLRSVGIALMMIAGLELTYAVLHFGITQLPGWVTGAHGLLHRDGGSVNPVRTLPVLPVLGTLGLAGIVIVGAKAAELLVRKRAPAVDLVLAPRAAPSAQAEPVTSNETVAVRIQ